MKFTYAKTARDLKEIADQMGRIFRRKNWFEFYKSRMDYQTRAPYYKPEHSRIARENGKIVGHVSIVEKYLRVGSSPVKTAGIGDVFTHPDYRGRHVSSSLMKDAIQYMKRKKYPLSMLYGIPNFYHKFGYIEAMGDYKITLPLKHAASVTSSLGIRPFREGDIPALDRLYNENYREITGSIRRVPASWYNIADPKRLFAVEDSGGRVKGYLIYNKIWGGGGYISEAVASSEESRRALLAFASGMARESFQSDLEFRLGSRDPFAAFLKDFGPRVHTRFFAEGEGNAMLRLVNLSRFLKKVKPVLEERISGSCFARRKVGMNFKTDDAGRASLLIERGKIEVSASLHPDFPVMETPQNLLTRSVLGYWSLDRLRERVRAAGGGHTF